jgi:hypothetical protein
MDYSAWSPSSGPTVVIYDDGLVIYQSPKEILIRKRHDYSWVRDFRYMAARVQDSTAFIQELFPNAWTALKDRYELSEATDQVTTVLWHRGQIVEIYGDWRRTLPADHYGDSVREREMVERENAMRHSLPKELRQFLKNLDNLTYTEAKVWLPEMVEIELSKYSRAGTEVVAWPPNFPKPVNIRYGPVPDIAEADVLLPAKQYAEFQEVLRRTVYPGVVSIDGSNFIVSNFTFPFPGREVWRRDLAKKREREKAELLMKIEKLPADKQKEMRSTLGLGN